MAVPDIRPNDLSLKAVTLAIATNHILQAIFNFALARYDSTGQLDQAFGTGGKVVTPVASNSNGYAVTIQGAKITLAGAVANSQSPFDFGVARYLGR